MIDNTPGLDHVSFPAMLARCRRGDETAKMAIGKAGSPILAPMALAIFSAFLAILFFLKWKLDFQVVSVNDQADGTLICLLAQLHQELTKRTGRR